MAAYQHRFFDDRLALPTPQKAVCVGQNYLAHMQEMGGAPVSEAMFFIKPLSAFVGLSEQLAIPRNQGAVHFELELVVLLGKALTNASEEECLQAIVGYAAGLDLTLRDVQAGLKKRGHPWERSKAFDGSAAISPFVLVDSKEALRALGEMDLQLHCNGELRQQGNTRQLLRSIATLLSQASHCFTLAPGDVLFTGTPAGVGPLQVGDDIALQVGEISMQTRVV